MSSEAFSRDELKTKLDELAAQQVQVGTSSWKYEGWCGMIYDPNRYFSNHRFSNRRFQDECLREYSRVFKTVCVDAGYYKFPDEKMLEKLAGAVPSDFRFGLKVTQDITIKRFPRLDQHGDRAGQINERFLDHKLFQERFLAICAPFRQHIGILIFEFSHFHASEYAHGRDFVADLDRFLEQLPGDWQYGVEVRNPNLLRAEYFEALTRHRIAHVFNHWTHMPPVQDQMRLEGSQTTDFTVARFLLAPGRTYEQAVAKFSPYREIKEVDEAGRQAARELVRKSRSSTRPSFVFVNNRFEGNALQSIAAMVAD
jgi:uncharacterized protein YecE (DUF72 family)